MPIPWYVMTSPATHSATVTFFQEHKHFGLAPDQVFFFQQVCARYSAAWPACRAGRGHHALWMCRACCPASQRAAR